MLEWVDDVTRSPHGPYPAGSSCQYRVLENKDIELKFQDGHVITLNGAVWGPPRDVQTWADTAIQSLVKYTGAPYDVCAEELYRFREELRFAHLLEADLPHARVVFDYLTWPDCDWKGFVELIGEEKALKALPELNPDLFPAEYDALKVSRPELFKKEAMSC